MGSEKYICQWKGCTSQAAKHAVIGLSVFDAAGDPRTSQPSYEADHFDLCEKHLELARLQYMHFQEYPLGKCPEPAKDR